MTGRHFAGPRSERLPVTEIGRGSAITFTGQIFPTACPYGASRVSMLFDKRTAEIPGTGKNDIR